MVIAMNVKTILILAILIPKFVFLGGIVRLVPSIVLLILAITPNKSQFRMEPAKIAQITRIQMKLDTNVLRMLVTTPCNCLKLMEGASTVQIIPILMNLVTQSACLNGLMLLALPLVAQMSAITTQKSLFSTVHANFVILICILMKVVKIALKALVTTTLSFSQRMVGVKLVRITLIQT